MWMYELVVPEGALVLNFVLNDGGAPGAFDNNGGQDYHIVVDEGFTQEQRVQVGRVCVCS